MTRMRNRVSYPDSRYAVARSLSNSGMTGGLSSLGSSIGSISPRPGKGGPAPVTMLRGEYGVLGGGGQSGNVLRGDFLASQTGSVRSLKNLACTVTGLSPGMRISRLYFGSETFAMAGCTSAKNAASSQNCSFLYGANGWLWHWAHSILTPRKSRLA